MSNKQEGDNRVEFDVKAGNDDTATQHIDRLELFRSSPPAASQTQTDSAAGKTKSEPDVLDLGANDPLAKLDARSLMTPGAKPEPALDARPGDANLPEALRPAGDDTGASEDLTRAAKGKRRAGSGAGRESTERRELPPQEPIRFLNDFKNLDPNKPTVLFLDDFRPGQAQLASEKNRPIIKQPIEIALNEVAEIGRNGVKTSSELGFTHGEFSARMAEKNGFNAIRVQSQDNSAGTVDFSRMLNGVLDKINSGELKMGPGDAVNVSLGNGDLTFDQINFLLGSTDKNKITKENVKEPEVQRDILKRLGDVAEDSKQPQIIRDWARNSIETNNAIQKLQEKGIEVIHAAANSGPNSFSIEFMSAKHELSSFDPQTGRPDKFTTEHARITPANGVLPIRFQPGTEQGGSREGKYTVEGTGITFRGYEFGELNMQQTVSLAGKPVPREDAAIRDVFDSSIGRQAPPRINENGYLVAVAVGNSFANIQFLANQRERMATAKRQAN